MTIAKTRQNLLKIANGCQKFQTVDKVWIEWQKLHDDCKNSPKFAQKSQRMAKVSNVFIVFHCFSPFFIVFHCLSSIFWNIEKSITNTSFLTSFSMKDAESAQFTPSSFWGIFRWLHIIDVNKSEIVPVFVVNQICGDLHRLIVQNQFFCGSRALRGEKLTNIG